MSRPLPEPTEISQGFWDAARRHELVAQRCDDCNAWRHYPQLRCPSCLSGDWHWAPLSGSGIVHTFTVTHQAFHPEWKDRVPYAIAVIELEEGIRMVTDVRGEDVGLLRIGARVEVGFDDVDPEVTLPRFTLVRDE
jgi:uncharacterized OB-fold protein